MDQADVQITSPLGSSVRADAAAKIIAQIDGVGAIDIGPALPDGSFRNTSVITWNRRESAIAIVLPLNRGFRCLLVEISPRFAMPVMASRIIDRLRVAQLPPEDGPPPDERSHRRSPVYHERPDEVGTVGSQPADRYSPPSSPPRTEISPGHSANFPPVNPQITLTSVDREIYNFVLGLGPEDRPSFILEGLTLRLMNHGWSSEQIDESLRQLTARGVIITILGAAAVTPPYQQFRVIRETS